MKKRLCKWSLVFLAFMSSLSVTMAGESMTRHLREAIRLNKSRQPLYAELTDGESLAISRRLILLEKAALPAALTIDGLARRFQRRGVPIVYEDLIPMEMTPDFSETGPTQPLTEFVAVNGRELSRTLRAAKRRGGFPEVSRVAFVEMARIQDQPVFHAMTRHMLESIIRLSNLAHRHDDLARQLGMGSTLRISKLLFECHLLSLGESARLDARAAPIQARGIPILTQDVPHIPPYSDFYGDNGADRLSEFSIMTAPIP